MTAHPSSDNKSLLPPGTRAAGRYEVVRVLGKGAQGIVYEARRDDGERVALKVIHRHLLGDRQIFRRFHREANILKRLEGEHLVRFVDFIDHDGLLMIALELVEATSLEELLRKEPIALKTAFEITLQICAALGVAHAAGTVHRDLKPANVLVEHAGDGDRPLRVRVVDFGLAKVVHGEQMSTGLTEQDMIFGTPEYMAPEQARGDDADGRADLYAAGVMLYEMAVGTVPFHERTPLATMTAHLTQEPPAPRSRAPGRGISAALETVIQRALAKDPADRYPTARAFAEALAAARDQAVVITPRKLAAGDATSDTDLSLSTTGLGIAKTLPEMAPLPRDSIAHTQKSPALPPEVDAGAREREAGALVPAPPSTARRDRWIWALVLVAAVVGVAIGAFVGAR
ncbi:MAG TPA: serine/threonine-protein kinase [Minicystis sp.]|nr:serine/threonine-protein kinase [Minicystis sp.]